MQLVSILAEDPGVPTVLMGDFNEWRRADANLRALHDLVGDVPSRPRSFPARRPVASLDRIWIRPPRALLHMRAHDSPLARSASDHLPVVAALLI
jgi:endonuclease/exonuclease/phosphatase family metal-dependent hydrolase